jgi:hypothetical protein
MVRSYDSQAQRPTRWAQGSTSLRVADAISLGGR